MPEKVENLVYRDNPLFAMIPKDTSFTGESKKVPLIYGNPQNSSPDISVALAGSSTSQLKAFLITRVKRYSIANVDNEVLLASKGNSGAFLEAATLEIDGALHSCARHIAIDLFRTGGGSIGNVANTSLATTTLTLSSVESVTNFEVGMILQLSATDGTGSVKAGQLQIVAVDRSAGTLTVDANISTGVATAATNDYIFQKGSYGTTMKGILGWIPSTAPTAGDNFFGVDRSVDTNRLAGIRVDGSAMPIEEALIQAATLAAREGARPDHCFMSYANYANLEKSLSSKVVYVDVKPTADIMFQAIVINGPRGPIKVIPDQNCPSDRAFMLQMNTWKLHSLGKCPGLFDTDGTKWLRSSSTDGVQARVTSYHQLACYAPGFNVNIKLA